MPYAIARETLTQEPYEFKPDMFDQIVSFLWVTIERSADGSKKVLHTQPAQVCTRDQFVEVGFESIYDKAHNKKSLICPGDLSKLIVEGNTF